MKTSYYAMPTAGRAIAATQTALITANPTKGIAISRYPPSGWSGLHYPNLAPSTDLLNGFKQKRYTIEDYTKSYQQQLEKLDPQLTWNELHELTDDMELTLLCFEKPKAELATSGYKPLSHDQNLWFCHRRLIATWLESNLNLAVPEVLKEKPGFKQLGFIRSGLNDLKA